MSARQSASRLRVPTPVNALEAANKQFVEDKIAEAITGGGSIAIGDVTGLEAALDGKQSISVYDPNGVSDDAFSQDNMVDGTTNKNYTSTEKTKLSSIEANADVTNSTRVDAAGAVMNTDSSTAAMSFVVDEDNFASNSATKVPTQQSVKAYIDSTASVKENSIASGTTSDYWRGDKAWTTLDKSAVGLPNVDNTSDATKNSASATLQNKTLNNTNTIVVKDTLFTIQDDADPTKQVQFQTSGITTATTRTLTIPNVSGALYAAGGTDVAVADGGTGRSTSTTAYGLIAAGTTATGPHQTIAPGTAGQFLKSAGASALGSFAAIAESDVTNLVTDLAAKEATSNKNQANGYCGLGSDGKVASAQLPSYVDDVLEAANFAALPGTGETGKIYITIDNNKQFRWSGSAYVEITSSPGSTDAVPEGSTNLYYTNTRAAAAAPVQTVAGRTGTVTLAKADVGLGSVDNTSDATKNAASVTLTNKTISGSNNTLSNIAQSSVTNLTTDLAAKAADSAVVHKTGNETVGGVKTFSAASLIVDGNSSKSTVKNNDTAQNSGPSVELVNTAATLTGAVGARIKSGITDVGATTAYLDISSVNSAGTVVDQLARFDLPTKVLTLGGALALGANKITGLGDGTSSTDAVTKGQLDAGLGDREPAFSGSTTATYFRGDKSWQTLNKSAVGLNNVDNTSDATKNSASATLTGKTMSGSSNTFSNISADSTVDGTTNKVYTATEKTKLSGIEAGADVTDATNVAAAGAVMAGASGSVVVGSLPGSGVSGVLYVVP